MKNKIKKIFIIFIMCVLINSTMGIIMSNAYYYEGIPQGTLTDTEYNYENMIEKEDENVNESNQKYNTYSDNCTESYGTSFKDIKVSDITDEYIDTSSDASANINAMIGAMITVSQIVMSMIASIFVIKTILNYIKNLKIKYTKTEKNEEELKKDNEEILRLKNKRIFYIIFSVVLFWIAATLQIIKNFAHKPIIYLYPEKEQKVKLKLKNKEKLTCTYPKYKDGWEVMAKPNGNLVDCETGRNLYALYWEGKNTVKHNLKEGFIVKGEDTIKFLEEKLEILGLNEREAEEFIVYWLPKLESNKYNFIRFETMEEIEENMPLEIDPKPDTLIRVMMVFKGLKIPMEVKEQELETPERKGFTVVEWGGTEI